MIVNVGLRRFSGGGVSHILNTANFYLPLNDAGAGIANLTLARGTGAATYTGATSKYTKLITGNWASVASGQPRFCYFGGNTVAAASGNGGYLSELAATQLVTPTASIRDMTDASWVKVNVTATKTATGITGVANSASRLTATANGGTILQTLVAAASSRTYHCFIRRVTGTGTILIQQGATTLDVTASLNSSTYTWVQLPASVLNSAYGITMGTSGDVIEVDFNGFEAGIEATSPIDTAGATRAADVLTYLPTGNIDFTQGTSYAEVSLNLPIGANTGVNKAFVATMNGMMIGVGNTAPQGTRIQILDSTTTATKTGLTEMSTAFRKRAGSWGAGGIFVTGDGQAPASDVFDGSMGATGIGIGCFQNGIRQSNGTIKNVRIWLNQLPSTTLQALTL
jgi:hypothetical protein